MTEDTIDGQLFESGDDWWHNACLHYSDNWDQYVQGYRRAGDILAEHAMEHRMDLDGLILPILFNYRQHLELILKRLIRDANLFLRTDKKFKGGQRFPLEHSLKQLWPLARRVIEEVCREVAEPGIPGEMGNERFDEIDIHIDAFEVADPRSMAFRYPADRDGNSHLAGITLINVRRVQEVMTRIADTLACAHDAIMHYSEVRAEMESYYRQDQE